MHIHILGICGTFMGGLAVLAHPKELMANIDPLFQDAAFDPGRKYSIPYMWGTVGIGYRKSAVSAAPDSWKVLLDSPEYAGSIALLADQQNVLGAGLKYLGYSWNSTNADELEKVEDLLMAQKKNIKVFAPDNGQDLLASGEVKLCQEWNGDIKQVMTELTDGRLEVTVPHTEGKDELADMARAVETFRATAIQAVRAEIALSKVSANIMMSDKDGIITYANPSIVDMFATAEEDIRQALPHFAARSLVGRNIDLFHRDPSHQRRLMAAMTTTHRGTAKVGRRTFQVIANPVKGRHGEDLGTVIEWKDLTDELAIESEIEEMVEQAVHGDFSRRIALEGKGGFFLLVSERINQLAGNIADVTEELASMLEALAQGDLSRRIDKTYGGVFQRLKDDFNTTVEHLSGIVGRIDGAAQAIGIAAREVSAGSANLAERTEQQASSLEETAASMEQLAATVRSNAEGAQQVEVLRPPVVMVAGHRARAAIADVPRGLAEAVPNGFAAPVFQNRFVAMRAPSAIAASFAHTTSGSTAACPTQVP